MCRQSATVCLVKSPTLEGMAGLSLVERLRLLPDPRRRRGVRHPFVAVLLVAASAVVAGARSYTAIGQWSANAPQHALARLGARVAGALSVRVAPSAATIRRVVGLVCPGGLADLTGAAPAGSDSVAIDGKTARGSRRGQTPAAHLLAAMTGDGRTVTQLRVPDKTNEITCFAALLAPFDLTGVTVTAVALHTQRAHACFLVEEKKAHYLLVVKANQPELHRRLRSLPWKDVTARRYDREIGHGRRETRATRALTVTDLGLDFPHAAQAVRILRYRTNLTTGVISRQAVYAITDLTSHQASPQRLGQLARSQWTIENRLHFVRDTTFAEDASKIRTGHGPENMAALRNLAINTLRAAGHRNIAAGIRHVSYEPFTRPLALLGIA
ncbi:ISAs1 family transposase [Streptomyces sp. NBC_00201]|uniref:ISAs1 family transposase n=1 Tax=unclassified Streptomyces TaxID=2593676 RepID=UPI002255182D|nr:MULTISPECIES: ISAs1 family transposase [unclassified Streptomyces]MCX5060186.1 ISAs1 family transposase [Streptomyces sp. NBC_00452]MCX5252035.1 ISAs1 family transposase [Streptomyces sp. NBC_00201]